MSKVLLEYNEQTGELRDNVTGSCITHWMGLALHKETIKEKIAHVEVIPKREITDQIAHFKSLGIEVNGIDDLIKMKENNII